MHASTFQLLELPDGRWCVARIAQAAGALIAGSFAPLHVPAPDPPPGAAPGDAVGIFNSRDEAELAIQRELPASRPALFQFAQHMRKTGGPG